jgi:hypothetical protein
MFGLRGGAAQRQPGEGPVKYMQPDGECFRACETSMRHSAISRVSAYRVRDPAASPIPMSQRASLIRPMLASVTLQRCAHDCALWPSLAILVDNAEHGLCRRW